ncbi:unnamed protein product [Thelazia callipaeda]|uniref:Uncharacterized protein n=1 Tax=Thelazia callipaeda TaxID=103827 RepID=A0A0N5CLI7_THECL|nr:unnamed protein product [Thelazia callipaeda]
MEFHKRYAEVITLFDYGLLSNVVLKKIVENASHWITVVNSTRAKQRPALRNRPLVEYNIGDKKVQPFFSATKSNLELLNPGVVDEKLFSSVDSSRPDMMRSLANIWDDGVIDDKNWNPAPLTSVQFDDFARSINVELPVSKKPIKDFSNSVVTTDQMAALTKNIANLRTSDERSLNIPCVEEITQRNYGIENVQSFDLASPFPSRDEVDWSNPSFTADTFAGWRSNIVEPPVVSVAARIASTRHERLPFSSNPSYGTIGNHGYRTNSFGTDTANINLGQQSAQAWNRIRFQQAAQAASNEYESLTNLLSSYRPTSSSQHHSSPSQQHPQSVLPVGNVNYSASSAAIPGSTSFAIPAPRSQITNTSIPPPPFFNSQIPPPSPLAHRAAIPVTHSTTNLSWQSLAFGGQTQASNVTENTMYPQYSSATRGNWNYNW